MKKPRDTRCGGGYGHYDEDGMTYFCPDEMHCSWFEERPAPRNRGNLWTSSKTAMTPEKKEN